MHFPLYYDCYIHSFPISQWRPSLLSSVMQHLPRVQCVKGTSKVAPTCVRVMMRDSLALPFYSLLLGEEAL